MGGSSYHLSLGKVRGYPGSQGPMRPLTDDETKVFFEKLSKYIGRNIEYLIDRKEEPHCFRLIKDRVYYMSEMLARQAASFPKEKIMCVGVCFGKFTKGGAFRLHVTALEYLAQFATFKAWIRPQSEMSYLYGNHLLKGHVAKMTEGVPEHQGMVILNCKDVPLGFAVSAKSGAQISNLDGSAIAAFHQADIGEYLRDEETLF